MANTGNGQKGQGRSEHTHARWSPTSERSVPCTPTGQPDDFHDGKVYVQVKWTRALGPLEATC
jgi:hypothetical protein